MLAGQKRKRSLSISEAMTQAKEQVNVARYTFAVYNPSTITAMKIDMEQDLCVIARENGQIELWHISSWTMLFSMPSHTGEMIRNLHFNNKELISTSLNGNIILWNFSLLKPQVYLIQIIGNY